MCTDTRPLPPFVPYAPSLAPQEDDSSWTEPTEKPLSVSINCRPLSGMELFSMQAVVTSDEHWTYKPGDAFAYARMREGPEGMKMVEVMLPKDTEDGGWRKTTTFLPASFCRVTRRPTNMEDLSNA